MVTINYNTAMPRGTYHLPADASCSHAESHIIKKAPFMDQKVAAHKFTKSITEYAPRGMKGSKNANFYEFLSLGTVATVVGSGMLIALSNAAKKTAGTQSKEAWSAAGKKMAAGVLLYAAGKYAGEKVANKLIKGSTAIDLDMPCKSYVTQLREGPGGEEKVKSEFHKVFASRDWYRQDLLLKDGDKRGDRFYHYDKMTKKVGYKEKMNAPDQLMHDKIQETISRAQAGTYISKYLWAALGVALGTRESFGKTLKPFKEASFGTNAVDKVAKFAGNIKDTFKNAAKELVNGGTGSNAKAKGVVGKGLIIAAAVSTLITWANVTTNFKKKPKVKSEIDVKKGYEVV
ncbi:hypothetical protein tpqmel_0189 [Candidatus Gastranaerophilus sp. (ex Termes propinquus)]|nr:hypothetical protein tpqmel_0189 [Candidatus Gastranaerophilus sp. (ex Termes propinquus)]